MFSSSLTFNIKVDFTFSVPSPEQVGHNSVFPSDSLHRVHSAYSCLPEPPQAAQIN